MGAASGAEPEATDLRTRLLVIQPTSLCNLDCSYCYLPGRRDPSRMQPRTLDAVLRLALSSRLVRDEIEFLWHAGEPLTAGIDFYRDAVTLIRGYCPGEVHAMNTLQTNATLVNDEWARFFAENGFSIGVSIDGPEDLHDAQRRRWSTKGSHATAMRGVNILRDHGLDPGVICVLTRDSLARPEDIFAFFLDHGFTALGFNVEEAENVHLASSLRYADAVDEYRRFFDCLYDLWWPNRSAIKIREFDDFGSIFLSYRRDPGYVRPVLETQPLGIVTVQKNGDVSTFSPEFAGVASPAFGSFVIGNVHELSSFDDLAEQPRLRDLAAEVRASVGLCRSSCHFFPICGGEFLSNKFTEHGTLRATETGTCLLHRKTLSVLLLDKLSP